VLPRISELEKIPSRTIDIAVTGTHRPPVPAIKHEQTPPAPPLPRWLQHGCPHDGIAENTPRARADRPRIPAAREGEREEEPNEQQHQKKKKKPEKKKKQKKPPPPNQSR